MTGASRSGPFSCQACGCLFVHVGSPARCPLCGGSARARMAGGPAPAVRLAPPPAGAAAPPAAMASELRWEEITRALLGRPPSKP